MAPSDLKQSPLRRRAWRSLGLIAIVAVLVTGMWWMGRPQPSEAAEDTNTAPEEKRLPVLVNSVQTHRFERRVNTQGDVEAQHVAVVSPRVAGILDAILVDEGDSVVGGETVLFRSDAVKLQQGVVIQTQKVAINQCQLQQAQASSIVAEVNFEKAQLDFERFQRLLEKQAATQDAFEQQQSRFKQARANKVLAQSQVNLATEEVRQAQADLEIARKDLADAQAVAPISGRITQRMQETGEMGAPGQPVLRIEDVSLVEVSAFLPASLYAAIQAGQTQMQVTVAAQDVGSHLISYKSPTINRKRRTFEVKCLISNPSASMAPGAMAEIVVVLEQRRALGVPAEAIQQRDGQSVVFVVQDEYAVQRTVQTGLETDGWVELVASEVSQGDSVVYSGQFLLDNGSAVSVQQGDK
jgi:RND family efflux transporter MFP subunit